MTRAGGRAAFLGLWVHVLLLLPPGWKGARDPPLCPPHAGSRPTLQAAPLLARVWLSLLRGPTRSQSCNDMSKVRG